MPADGFRKVFDKQGLQKYKHRNGLTVIFRPKKNAESVTLEIGSRAGLVHHPLTHLDHHMILRGTPVKTGIEIKKEAVQLANTFDCFTDFYSTVVFMKIDKRASVRQSFQLLCDIIRNPSMDAAALAKEKPVVILEIKHWNEEPKRILRQSIFRAVYKLHPARKVILEDPQVTAEATRAKVVEIHKKFYGSPQRLVIVAVGKFNPTRLLKMIGHCFGDLPKRIEDPFGVPEEEMSRKTIKPIVCRWRGKEAHLMLGFRAPLCYHSDYYPMRLLSGILGEDLDSRLYTELREKTGLVHIRGPLNPASEYDASPWHGVFYIYAPCSPHNLSAIKKIIQKELRKLAQERVPEEELRRNKKKLIIQHILSLEGTKKHAHSLFAAEINGTLEKFDDFSHRIQTVKAEDIQRAARTYCHPSKLVCAALKPPQKPREK